MRYGLTQNDLQTNRRTEARTPLARRLDVLPCWAGAMGNSFAVEMTDCAPSGVGLLANAPMPVGQQFLVKAKIAGKIKLLIYTVQNCQPAERVRHRVGARFAGVAGDERSNDPDKIMAALLAGA